MDELLINASLKERNPSSLPWCIDEKEKNKGNDSVDKSTSPVDEGILTHIEQHQMELRELDESCKTKCNDDSRYIGVNPGVNLQNETKSGVVNMVNSQQVESKDKKEDLTYFRDSHLSRKDVSHNANDYSKKIPSLHTINNQREKQDANPAAICLSECGADKQINRRRSPRCSLKVSRKMIQESKLEYSVPLQSERTLSKRKDEMSISSDFTRKKKNKYETKQIKQGQITVDLKRKVYLPKNLDGAVSTSIASLKRENHEIVSNNPEACRELDLNVENELDELLKITADAINYKSNNKTVKGVESAHYNGRLRHSQSKDERYNRVESSAIKSKDCKSQDSCVSRDLVLARKINDAENSAIRYKNEIEPKLVKPKEWDRAECSLEEGVVAIEYHRDKTLEEMYRIDDIQKRRAENMRVKELGKRYNGEVSQDIRCKMDIVDGIGVEGFDKEAQEPLRKKHNIKKRKRREKKNNGFMLETEKGTRNKGRIRGNAVKGNKYNASISRGNDGMYQQRPLVDKTDNGEDIFDISPIKNKETLSDLEDEGSNTCGNYMNSKSDLTKRDYRKEHKRNHKVDVSNVTKLIPGKTKKVPSKDKSKRSKKGKKEKVTNTTKKKDTKVVDKQISPKKQKKKKSTKVSKTSVEYAVLPTEETTGKNKSDNGRLSGKTCDVVPKTKTSKVNLHVLKADNEKTHKIVDDLNDSYKNGHRLKSSKSYTLIKHGMNTVARIDMRVNNECDIDKVGTESGNPSVLQHVEPKNVKAGNEGKTITDSDIFKGNVEQYQKLLSNARLNDDLKTTNMAKTKECSNQENINNFPDKRTGDFMCDSDIDSDMISDIQYQQYLIQRPSSGSSSEFEFPRPASNRTFIIDTDIEVEDSSKSLQEENRRCNLHGNENEKKLSKKQRVINFIMCCLRPKTD